MDKKELNVLVLCMSTLPRGELISNSFFGIYDNKKVTGKYVGSLEPGTKYLMRVLGDKGDKFDKIVILNTQKTVQKEKDNKEKSFTKYLYLCEKEEAYSPESFFKGRIENYIKENKGQISNVAYQDNIDNLFMSIMLERELGNGEFGFDDMAAYNICEEVMGLADEGQKINVYLNMQGGIRTTMFIVKAALDLLRERNVEIKEQVAVDYTPGEGGAHEVKFVADEYLIMDLVVGMRSFVNYGRADELIRYLGKRQRIQKDSLEGKLVDIIRDIAESIQISDPVRFERSLNMLKDDRRLLDKESYQDTYFKIAVDDIKTAYEPLLSEDTTTVDTIQWFCDRGFVSQSLTFIEDKMPEYYTNRFITVESPISDNELVGRKLEAPSYDTRVSNAIINNLPTRLGAEIVNEYSRNVKERIINHYVDINIDRIRAVKRLPSADIMRNNLFDEYWEYFEMSPIFDMVDVERVMSGCRFKVDDKQFDAKEISEFIKTISSLNDEESSVMYKLTHNYKQCKESLSDDKYISFLKAIENFRKKEYDKCNSDIKNFSICMKNEIKRIIPGDGLVLRKSQLEKEREIYGKYILCCCDDTSNGNKRDNKKLKLFGKNTQGMIFGNIGCSIDSPNYYFEVWKMMITDYTKNVADIDIDVEEILKEYLADSDKQVQLSRELTELTDSDSEMSDDICNEFYEKYLRFTENNDKLQKNKNKTSWDISYCNSNFYHDHCGQEIAKLYEDNQQYLKVEDGYMYKTIAGVKHSDNIMLKYIDSISFNPGIAPMKLEKLLRLHSALKQERNNTNHASEKCMRLPLSVIKKAIYLYIKWVREIEGSLI
ncbi:MAG: hypothetical protein IJX85_04660 [Lachnospiraceae bacterium]|nr:hypothetical protein [Lachnospiraceae bacterium]